MRSHNAYKISVIGPVCHKNQPKIPKVDSVHGLRNGNATNMAPTTIKNVVQCNPLVRNRIKSIERAEENTDVQQGHRDNLVRAPHPTNLPLVRVTQCMIQTTKHA